MDIPQAAHAILSTEEMGAADRLTIASGVPGSFLMEQAGAAVARQALILAPNAKKTVVLCGPGNNGGDGFVAARLLRAQGREVELCLLGAADRLKGDAAEAAKAFGGKLVPVEDLEFNAADLVIDAIFGAGLARDLEGEVKTIVAQLNAWSERTGKPVLAIDVPSGIDGSSGEIRGIAVQARQTITFFRYKPGHFLLPGRIHCGEIQLADIGISSRVLAEIQPLNFINHPGLWGKALPVPNVAGNKYSRGHALVVSGGLAQTGAARLAARGALRAGAGLVTVATPSEALMVHAMALTAIMTKICDGASDLQTILADRRKNALVLGPGFGVGETTCQMVHTALRGEPGQPKRGFVFDADVLTSFSGQLLELGRAIRASASPVVLTPHEGEFARLFGALETADARLWEEFFQPDEFAQAVGQLKGGSKLARARAAALLSGAVVLLKGPDSIVAEPSGRATISEDLPAWLATAGSGDVLAGMIAGLMAQHMPCFEATSAAVWLHGAAARHFGPGLISEDIPETLPKVLSKLIESGLVAA